MDEQNEAPQESMLRCVLGLSLVFSSLIAVTVFSPLGADIIEKYAQSETTSAELEAEDLALREREKLSAFISYLKDKDGLKKSMMRSIEADQALDWYQSDRSKVDESVRTVSETAEELLWKTLEVGVQSYTLKDMHKELCSKVKEARMATEVRNQVFRGRP